MRKYLYILLGLIIGAFVSERVIAQPNAVPVTGTVTVGSGTITVGSITAGDTDIGNVDLEIAGTAIAVNAGAASAQTLRTISATDSPDVTSLATIAGDTTNIETAIQLIDNAANVTPDDNFANPTGALVVYALTGCWDGATWDRCTGSSADTELMAAFPGADNVPNPTTSGVHSFLYGWDGAAWDRVSLSQITEVAHSDPLTLASTKGSFPAIVAKDFDGSALPNAVDLETDAQFLSGSLAGVLYVMPVNEDGSATSQIRLWDGTDVALIDGSGNLAVTCSNCSGSGVSVNEDVPSADAHPGTPAYTVRQDALSTLTSLDGDYQPAKSDSVGAMWTRLSTAIPAGTNNIGDVDILSFPDNEPFNLAQMNGATTPMTTTQADDLALTLDALNVTAFMYMHDGTNYDMVRGNPTDGLLVNLGANNDVTVTSGTITTVSTVTTLSQFGGNAINLGTGTIGTGTLRMTVATDDDVSDAATLFEANLVAHDAVDAGSPLKIGAKASNALNGVTLVANGDRTDLYAGLDGVLITRPHTNLEDRVSAVVGVTDGSSTSLVASQGAGLKFCATTFVASNSSATNVTVDIRDGTAGTVLMTIPAAANMGGAVIPLSVPLCTSDATAMAMDPSAAASTITVTAIGFKTTM